MTSKFEKTTDLVKLDKNSAKIFQHQKMFEKRANFTINSIDFTIPVQSRKLHSE